jgi:phosphoribosylformylglycinamidine synthase
MELAGARGQEMAEVRALVLRAAGVNCDMETRHALELAGAEADRIHVNRLIEDKSLLDRYHIVVFPGGFSYGDDVAAGRILANQIVHHLADPIRRFIDDGKLVLGICNGFQVLVKMGVLPGNGAFKQEQVTIT